MVYSRKVCTKRKTKYRKYSTTQSSECRSEIHPKSLGMRCNYKLGHDNYLIVQNCKLMVICMKLADTGDLAFQCKIHLSLTCCQKNTAHFLLQKDKLDPNYLLTENGWPWGTGRTICFFPLLLHLIPPLQVFTSSNCWNPLFAHFLFCISACLYNPLALFL